MDLEQKFTLFFILILAAIFRFSDINWDQGHHLHPDERAIIMDVLPLHLPTDFAQFISQNSPWNPHFFAYGSFPLYFLKIVSIPLSLISPQLATYDGINLLGRTISAFFDIGTIICIFFIGRKIKNKSVGFLGSFFYTVSVLPIQLSHFYAVDTILTFFLIATLLLLLYFYEKPTILKAGLIGITIAFALATKISAIVVIVSLSVVLTADFGLLFIKNPIHPKKWIKSIPPFLLQLIKYLLVVIVTAFVIYFILEPYTFFDFSEFTAQTQAQSAMTKNAFTFPYTLQYVGIVPYLYEIKNIFFWGMGPLLAIVSFVGTLFVTYTAINKHQKQQKWADELVLIIFFWTYIAIVGHFAVGFMRYMLPIYPLLCIFAALFVYKLSQLKFSFISKLHNVYTSLIIFILAFLLLIWPISFIHIYSQPNTRVQASNFINRIMPAGTTIAVEHWDDGLPLDTQPNYQVQTLAMYDPDTSDKWLKIIDQLHQSSYIIIASNRLFVPIQKLNDCKKYLDLHCYPIASIYYKNLFAGKPILKDTPYADTNNAHDLVFKKIAEFSITPQIPLVNLPIYDQTADESFTVYDHPSIIIFKKM